MIHQKKTQQTVNNESMVQIPGSLHPDRNLHYAIKGHVGLTAGLPVEIKKCCVHSQQQTKRLRMREGACLILYVCSQWNDDIKYYLQCQ